MALTDYRLIPTGRLLKLGIIPTQGEQWEGTMASTGVNAFKLSGTPLVGAGRAIAYSLSNHTNKTSLMNKLKSHVKHFAKSDSLKMPMGNSRVLWDFARTIRSVRAIAQEN